MKHIAKALALAVLAAFTATPLHAIQDANANGLSDLWEKFHNGGILFPLSQPYLAADDPDMDGWTNAEEAIAGTDPLSSAIPDGLVRTTIHAHPGVDGCFMLSWPSISGKSYRLSVSTNLSDWADCGDVMAGTGNEIALALDCEYAEGGSPGRLFWRVLIEDMDPDGDTLTSWEELALSTNPNHPDSDLDGIPDGVDDEPLDSATLANPDGLGLPVSIESLLIGRWDFEALDATGKLASTPESVGGMDSLTSAAMWDGQPAWTEGPTGMPSKCMHYHSNGPPAETQPTAYGKLPAAKFSGWNTQTWSMWMQFPKNGLAVLARRRTIFAMGAFEAAGDASQNPHVHCYLDPGLTTSRSDDRIKIDTYWLPGDNFTQRNLASWPVPTKLDDGGWHHLAVDFSNGAYRFHLDGAQVGTATSNAIVINLVQAGGTPWCYLGKFRPNPPSGFYQSLGARIDRLRVHRRILTAAELTALFRQDIDLDGLWDVTEQRASFWRDTNSDGIRTAAEKSFRGMNPFLWDEPLADHDRDGINSRDEQDNTGTDAHHPDTDRDRLSDGWEEMHGLDPHDPSDGAAVDTDGDGLTNLVEFMNGTDPTTPDSDGDAVNDNIEINHNGDPNDPSDGGQPPEAGQLLRLRLGIGDESGSESEDYHLVCYEYDPATFTEREVYRLVSGGHGQYDEKVSGIFRKWNMYTFKIEWQSSTLGTASGGGDPEGPDYDFTMKVETETPDSLLGVIDSFDPETGLPEAGYQLLGEHSNYENFETVSETKRVAHETAHVDLAVDTNLNRKIESLPDGVPPRRGWEVPVHSVADRDGENANPPRPTVIDVNNNNTDAADSQSGTKDEVDNRNASLDTEADRAEHFNPAEGHAFARLRLWANAFSGYGLSWKQANASTHFLLLSLPDASHGQIVRVYDWREFSEDQETPELLLGPGKTTHVIDVEKFFHQGTFGPGMQRSAWYRDLFVEGLTYGTARIRLDLVNVGTGQPDKSDEVLVTVNVDRVEQPPGSVASQKDARHLRGFQPHHLGLRKQGIHYEPVRAIQGDIVVRVPGIAGNDGWRTRHTPMAGRALRKQYAVADQQSSGSSIWVGLKQTDANGTFQWIQTGLRWAMRDGEEIGSYPAAYIESGDTHVSPIAKSLKQASAGNDSQLGEGVVLQDAYPLSTWATAPVKLSFVMFKPSLFNSEGQESSIEQPWYVIFRDERSGGAISESSYIRLSVGKPVSPVPLNSVVADQLTERYRTQQMKDMDVLFETNQSIAFAPGTSGEKAWIGNLRFAPALTAGSMPSPNLESGLKSAIYNWALATFLWQDVVPSPGDLASEIKTGRSLANGGAENGATAHPSWHAEVSGAALQLWDDREPDFHQTAEP